MTNYYVKNGGNNSRTGLSDEQAWATIRHVNGFNFSTGDCVYFKCDSTWTRVTLNIDWNGTVDNRVVIGAYYGNGIVGVSGNKPVFDGEYVFPNDMAHSLIYAYEQDYLNIENLSLKNSLGLHMNIAFGSNINVTNTDFEKAYNAGLKYHEVSSGIIEGCTVTNTGRKRLEAPGTNYPASVAVNRGCNNILVRNNIVYKNYGEGIGSYHYNKNCIFEYNTCYGNKAQIYIAHSNENMTIRYNLCYGINDGPTKWDKYINDGIGVASEGADPDGFQNNIYVYHNLVAYCYRGITLGAYQADSKIDNYFVYNNTVVDSRVWNFYNTEGPYVNSAVKNNIFWNTDDSIPEAVQVANTIDFDYNLWGKEPDVDAQGPNDPPYAEPKLMKTSGWNNLVGGELKPEDFMLQPDSPAIDAGTYVEV